MSIIRELNDDRDWFQAMVVFEGYRLSQWVPNQDSDCYIASLVPIDEEDGTILQVRVTGDAFFQTRGREELLSYVRDMILRTIDQHKTRKSEMASGSIITNQRQLREG